MLLLILGEAQGEGAAVAGADPVDNSPANQPDEEGLDSHDERQVRLTGHLWSWAHFSISFPKFLTMQNV